MGKRGQMEISFGMVFSIILVIAIIVVGSYAVIYFLGLDKKIKNYMSPPSMPENLSAFSVSSTEIGLKWSSVVREKKFLIERSNSPSSGFEEVGTTTFNKTIFFNKKLRPDTTYYYKIKSVNSYGANESAVLTVKTNVSESPEPPVEPPVTPSAENPNESIPPENVVYNKNIIISKGGTYSGNWESTSFSIAAVEIKTSQPVIIENSNIRSKGNLIEAKNYNIDLTIRNTRGYGLNPDKNMEVPGRFLEAVKFKKIIIEHNYLENTRGIRIDGPKYNTGTIDIRYNKVKNIDGRLSAGTGKWRNEDIEKYWDSEAYDVGSMYGQFVQLANVKSADVELAWNEIINEPQKSRAEDMISIFQSSGTSTNWIKIHDNYIQGVYPYILPLDSYTGGGIMAGDSDGCAYILAENNEVVSSSHYGISSTCGSHIKIDNNRIVSSGKINSVKISSTDSVGLALFKGEECKGFNDISAQNNVVGWYNSKISDRNDVFAEPESLAIKTSTLSTINEAAELTRWQSKLKSNGITIGPAD